MTRVTADQFRALPRDVATTPRDGDVYTDRWWVCTPDGLLFFGRSGPTSRGWSPQCNRDRKMADSLLADIYAAMFPGATVERFPVVYMGHWDPDWGHNPFRGLGIPECLDHPERS